VFTSQRQSKHWYLPAEKNEALYAFLKFLTYFVLYNTMIPISLIVTMEIVKACQGKFIEFDD